jgi:hypothetical protein
MRAGPLIEPENPMRLTIQLNIEIISDAVRLVILIGLVSGLLLKLFS